ncbi:MAG: peptigoglycan-binding protein LysM [Gammaproteobacteria bacterium]|nr:MAG: peptigoglycan-binding protein LysM [Gammaproteobacteria bacterium]
MFKLLVSLVFTLSVSATFATTFNLADDSTRIVGHNLIVYSHEEDTLLDIARQFDIGYEEIVTANKHLDPWLPGDNQRVLVPNRFILPDAPHKGIVINLAEMRLYYYPKKEKGKRQQVITHPIGVGREGWTTPLGKAKIIQKKKDPTWTPPASILAEHLEKGDPLPKVVPAGPDNPLGAYAMRLSMPGYLLHGTNRPFGVGMRVSHGCIRLFPEDIEHLFGLVDVNTTVEIVYQPYKAALDNGTLYIEAHAIQDDMDERKGNNMTPMVSAILKAQDKILSDDDWPAAETLVREHNGVVRSIEELSNDVVEEVWFVHTGLTTEVKHKLLAVTDSLKLQDSFWPLQDGADTEMLLGPFDSQIESEQLVVKINELTGLSAWAALLTSDSL